MTAFTVAVVGWQLTTNGRNRWDVRDCYGRLVLSNASRRDLDLLEAGRRLGEAMATSAQPDYYGIKAIQPARGGAA